MYQELLKRIDDLKTQTLRKNHITVTSFLDPAESAHALLSLKRGKNVRFVVSGGYEGAERVRLFFLPDYIDEDNFFADEYISVIRVSCPFGVLTHRDYLGSLMGLGIKRETLGDILIFDKYAYIICSSQIAGYIIENLNKIGRSGVECTLCALSEIEVPEPVFDVVSGTVASLRVDALTALAFGISRSTAAELIRDGRLSVDHIEQENPAADIGEGQLLSLRGYGRAKLYEVGGLSKKERWFVTFHVFSKK